jgi:hypothetical protein
MPVAFVWPLEPTSEPDASSAVVVVREFLQREIAAGGKTELTFQVLGPSPAHADFVLEEGTTSQDSVLTVETILNQATPVSSSAGIPRDWTLKLRRAQ